MTTKAISFRSRTLRSNVKVKTLEWMNAILKQRRKRPGGTGKWWRPTNNNCTKLGHVVQPK